MAESNHTNRLVGETSAYLLQHAYNPVDWYPWSEEAFTKAKAEDRPILLSVGYSACHWCHVMAHESFEDEATAELMNRHFINIKVDREERPDVDTVYMTAVQVMIGAGGWPMTVVMTPDREPFFGGTYFPPEDRYGRPGFRYVLESLADAWQNRRQEVLESASSMTQYLGGLSSRPAADGELTEVVLKEAQTALMASYNPSYGGFGGAPKFPPHSVLKFLGQRQNKAAIMMVEVTLTRMARGGIYDQLGGGFARYSVDEVWLVPHFEKMLYDNAQLVQRYLETYQRTGEPLYRRVAEETLAWVAREMTDASGGFYSALDADSEGEEGKFYLWEDEEFDHLLGEDAQLAKVYYGLSGAGNFEGRNILHVPHDEELVADHFRLSVAELQAKMGHIRKTLFAAREKRVCPGLDDKTLCSWNGLMLAALADAGRILGRQDYLHRAVKNAEFIRREMYRDGRLLHSYKDGKAKIAGLLEDYAFYGLGLLALYRANFDRQWLLLAFDLAEVIVAHFHDEVQGGFFSTADDGEVLIMRPKDFFDAAIPSDNGATAELLLALARLFDNRTWEALAAQVVEPMTQQMRKQASGFGALLYVLQHLLASPRELAIFGDPSQDSTQALLETIQRHPLTYTAMALAESRDDPLMSKVPFLRGRDLIDGKATVYICEGGVCRLPLTTVDALAETLSHQ